MLWEDENDEDEVEAADGENIFDVKHPLDDDLVQDIDGIDFATMFEPNTGNRAQFIRCSYL